MNLNFLPDGVTDDVTAPPVGPVDQLFLHVLGMVRHLLGFHVHWRGWDGFRLDVGHRRDRLQLRDVGSRFRFRARIRSWLRCRVVRFRFGIWSWFSGVNGGRFWYIRSGFQVGFGLRVGDGREGRCIRRRLWFGFHVGGWVRLVHRLGFPVIWLGLDIGQRSGFVR